ncbi:MAG: hypothetical protein K0S41_3173 [Anaerocolumna sp.]|nr:hypothetical protein [Anaerocolumna sp.]
MSFLLTTTEARVISALFIGIPAFLFLLHLFLSFRKNAFWGFVVPVLWGLLSIWIVSKTQTYPSEMIVFCIAIDILLIAIWAFIRFVLKKRKNKR